MILSRLSLLGWVVATAVSTAAPKRSSQTTSEARALLPRPALPAEQPPCEQCHVTASWASTSFDHDRTGFPLKGKHQHLGCKGCHEKDFQTPLPTLCVGCHLDAHKGELGQRCEGCHHEEDWQSLFTADAHRRTNFPLIGRHAILPCTECHFQVRDRTFNRTATDCIGCHQRQYNQTALTGVDHAAFGFGTSCRQCHDAWRFSPARWPGHDTCFHISSGSHAGIRCLSCHTTLSGATITGTCSTGTAACSRCHQHACTLMDQRHQNVPGYQCKDRKCYECHQLSGR